VLIDPLPGDPELRMAEQAQRILRKKLSISDAVLTRGLVDYSWRCCYLGVQEDDYSCGVWMPVIWREWLQLKHAHAHANLTSIAPPFCKDISIEYERKACSDILYPSQDDGKA
jgi:hypothetical protein